MVVAPASITASTTCARKSSSVREASSGENSTSSQYSRAIFTPSTARRMISSCAMLSLYWRWIALVARNTCSRWRGAGVERACRQLDVLARAARQARDDRALHLARHRVDRFPVPARGGRKARLDDIHAQFAPARARRAASPAASCCSRGPARRRATWCRRSGLGRAVGVMTLSVMSRGLAVSAGFLEPGHARAQLLADALDRDGACPA